MGTSIIENRKNGTYATKVLFGCFVAITGQENEAKFKGAGCDKTPKRYFRRIFSEDRDHKTKERGEFRTFGTGGAHGPGHQLEGLIRITYQCDTTQVALVASKDTHYVIPTSTTKFKSGSPGKVF